MAAAIHCLALAMHMENQAHRFEAENVPMLSGLQICSSVHLWLLNYMTFFMKESYKNKITNTFSNACIWVKTVELERYSLITNKVDLVTNLKTLVLKWKK